MRKLNNYFFSSKLINFNRSITTKFESNFTSARHLKFVFFQGPVNFSITGFTVMDGSRGSPVGTGFGGLGTVGSGLLSVGSNQGLVCTGSVMVITDIGMAGTGIGTGSGDSAGSVSSVIGGQFPSGSQTLAEMIDPNLLLAQQHLASGGKVSVKPPVFYRSNSGV